MSSQHYQDLASAARTADHNVPLQNGDQKGMLLVVDVTASTTGTVTPRLQVEDAVGTWVTIWSAAAAFGAVNTYSYLLYPGASGGNLTEVDGIPITGRCRLLFDHTDATSITYSARMFFIP